MIGKKRRTIWAEPFALRVGCQGMKNLKGSRLNVRSIASAFGLRVLYGGVLEGVVEVENTLCFNAKRAHHRAISLMTGLMVIEPRPEGCRVLAGTAPPRATSRLPWGTGHGLRCGSSGASALAGAARHDLGKGHLKARHQLVLEAGLRPAGVVEDLGMLARDDQEADKSFTCRGGRARAGSLRRSW